LERVLKIFERIIEEVRVKEVNIDNVQVGFMGGGGQRYHRCHFRSKTVAGKVHSEEKKDFRWHLLILRKHLTEYLARWSCEC